MLKKFAVTVCFLIGLTGGLFAQVFPDSAVILEKAKVTPAREMVLWMESPTKHPRDPEVDDIYTCPDETRGHFYSGVAKVSLIDLKTQKIIHTLEITSADAGSGSNGLDLPYLIHRGYYSVPKIDKNSEGKPVLMDLKDYNGDGAAREFALFDALACMGLPSTLIGYSAKQDRVIQYETELTDADGTTKEFWVDYFFGHQPNGRGVWKYEIDYRGRGGMLDKYELRYDRSRELFYGTRTSVGEAEKDPPSK
jgi:hypothetical protein